MWVNVVEDSNKGDGVYSKWMHENAYMEQLRDDSSQGQNGEMTFRTLLWSIPLQKQRERNRLGSLFFTIFDCLHKRPHLLYMHHISILSIRYNINTYIRFTIFYEIYFSKVFMGYAETRKLQSGLVLPIRFSRNWNWYFWVSLLMHWIHLFSSRLSPLFLADLISF